MDLSEAKQIYCPVAGSDEAFTFIPRGPHGLYVPTNGRARWLI